jgi:type IV pilus assembly protein PilQ
MIKPVLSTDAQVATSTPALSGINSGAKDVGGGSHATEDVIVVTDYPDNLEKVRKLLREVDRRPQQILIEATILRAALNEDNALGVDFALMGGVDFSTLSAAGTGPAGALSGSIINTPTNGAGGASSSTIVNNGYAGGQTGFTSAVPQGGLRVGLVKNNVAVFISALESITDTVVLANPKVLALNKQSGEVIVGRKDGYITTTVTETTQTQSVEFLDTGTRLIFRPFVGDDGYVRMEIHPEDSSGGLNSANLPFKITTEVTSNVMVKDGHTIVIGGLFRESSTTSRGQVPFLGNLPLAGVLFRNQRDNTVREEIIILLTPHIVKDDAAYSQLSEQQLSEAEKLRVGVRKGMMPWGRERLAEGCYEKAVEEKNHGKKDSAIWWLNCATNLNPKFTEAIDMKEELTGKVVTQADNSSIRTFLRKEMLMERPSGAAPVPASVPIDVPRTTAPSTRTNPPSTQPIIDAAVTTPATPTTQPTQGVSSEVAMSGDVESTPTTEPSTQPATATAEVPTSPLALQNQPPATVTITELPETPSNDANSSPSWIRSLHGFLRMFEPIPGHKVGDDKTAVTATPTEEAVSTPHSNGDH